MRLDPEERLPEQPELIDWDAPGPYRVAFSTRRGGVSRDPFATLNIGLSTDDEPERVLENRRRLCAAVGADPRVATMAWQQHGSRVVRATATGILGPSNLFERCDGLWSSEPGLAMGLITADCLPIAIGRSDGEPALCVLHAGWKGLLSGIVESGVSALGGGGFAAAIGPGIGPCCYEVGAEVARPFRAAFGEDVVGRPARSVDGGGAGAPGRRLRRGRAERPVHGVRRGAVLLPPARSRTDRPAGSSRIRPDGAVTCCQLYDSA